MVGPWVGAKIATARSVSLAGTAIARFTFDTPAADANGYTAEVGAKTLAVWSGAANVASGALRSNSVTLMRARFNAGSQPRYWRATFTTPADVTGAEYYLDLRDNGTSRLSCAFDTTHSYIYNGYTAAELTSAAAAIFGNTTSTIEVVDAANAIAVYLDGALFMSATTASGAGATSGGVTTIGPLTAVDTLEATD